MLILFLSLHISLYISTGRICAARGGNRRTVRREGSFGEEFASFTVIDGHFSGLIRGPLNAPKKDHFERKLQSFA